MDPGWQENVNKCRSAGSCVLVSFSLVFTLHKLVATQNRTQCSVKNNIFQ